MSRTADELYAVYQGLNPRRSPTPTPDTRKAMARILVECETFERAVLYLRWVAESQDLAALRLRKLAPWPDGELVQRNDPVSLSRNIAGRLDAVDAWAVRFGGAATPATLTVHTPADPRHASALAFLDAWAATGDANRPPVYRDHPERERARFVAEVLHAPGVGGFAAYYADPETTRRRFLAHLASRKAA